MQFATLQDDENSFEPYDIMSIWKNV